MVAFNRIVLLLRNASGGFTATSSNGSGGTSSSGMAAGDFNGDGKTDLAVANYGSANIGVLTGKGAGQFDTAVAYALGGINPRSIVADDFNADGNSDLAIVSLASNTIAVLLGNGRGGLSAPLNYDSGGLNAQSLALSDFNGDGRPDLAVANNLSNNVGILLGTEAGGFLPALTFACPSGPATVIASDLDADGNSDLAVANSSGVAILLGNGDGTFADAMVCSSGGSTPMDVASGDFNADGKQDLAVANYGSNNIGVLEGDGAGGFADSVTFESGGSAPSRVTVGDFDEDGNIDFAVLNASSNNLAVLLGNGAGGFSVAGTYLTGGSNPSRVLVRDLNGDGSADLVIANSGSWNVGVLMGNGSGGFSVAATYATGGVSGLGVTVTDLNRDGSPDLAVANSNDSNVGVLMGDGSGGFEVPSTYASGGTKTRSLVAGDFNEDGNADVAVVNIYSNNVGVLSGTASGSCSPAATYASGGSMPWRATAGDFNGDGKADLAVINMNTIGILLGEGSGRFATAVSYASGAPDASRSRWITTADFDADGDLDLAVTNQYSIGVLLGNGDGGFTDVVAYSTGGSFPEALAAGDFNSDGRVDLAVANSLSDTIAVLLGDGAGSFANAVTYASGGVLPYDLAVGDFNADGNADLAVANQGSNDVAILLGNGFGGFSDPRIFDAGGQKPMSLVAADLNADGKSDLIVVNSKSNSVGILLGTGSGGFSSTLVHGTAMSPQAVAVGDFDADGRPDLAFAHYDMSEISIVRNTASLGSSVHDLDSPGAFLFSVQSSGLGAGQLVEGTGNVFDGFGRLEVAGQTYAPPLVQEFTTDGERTLVTPTAVIDGLYVSREIAVPDTGSENFARTIDVFANPTDSPITTTVRIVGNLGSDDATTVWKTSDGDTLVEPTDQWIGTDDGDGSGTPAIVHLIHGPRGLRPTSIQLTGDRGDNIEWTYTVTVPARQTVRLAHFTILAETRAAAEAAADALVTADGFGGQAAAFLSAAEVDSLVNFDLPPTDITLSASSVQENRPIGTVVADLTTMDADLPADSHTYSLVSGSGDSENAAFEIVGAQFQTKAVFDYETNSSYSVRIRSTDLSGQFCEKVFTISVSDVDEIAPTITGTTPTFAASGALVAGAKSLAVNFSESVLGGEAANYQLQNVGPDALLGTPDDMILPLAVNYSGTTATLTFPALTESVYRLTVRDAITDAAGNMLDGDANGTAGGDWVREFATAPAVTQLPSKQGPFPTGPHANLKDIETADFNGDGLLDMVALDFSSNNVTLALGDGAGGFLMAGTFPCGGAYHTSMTKGDFNTDGKTDLAVGSSDGKISVLLGNGLGGFAAVVDYGSGPSGDVSLAAADFNNDGITDVVSANSLFDTIAILLGNGVGGLIPARSLASGLLGQESVTVGDFNCDGNIDIAVANRGSNKIGILLGNGSGGITSFASYASGGTRPNGVTVGDFNGDGKPDLAVANSGEFGKLGSDNIAVLSGNGSGGFAAAVPYACGGSPESVKAGDFNNDGRTDLVAANDKGVVGVLLGTDSGGFASVVTYVSGGSWPTRLALGDFNADERLDIAVTNSGSGDVGILLGNGAGGFAAVVTSLSGGLSPKSVAIGDFNGDGAADVVVSNETSNNIAVLLGNGAGGFAAAVTYASGGQSPRSVTVGDFNADGMLDLAVANSSSNNLGILLGNGAGAFASAVTYASGGSSPRFVASDDFNADGKIDLVVVHSLSNDVGVLLGDGSGGFAGAVTHASGGLWPWFLTVGDFNADGKSDLAVTNSGSNNIGILLGDGSGGFAAALTTASGGLNPEGVMAGDFNGDGKLDLAVANWDSNNVSVLLGLGSGGFPAAVNYASGGSRPFGMTSGDFNGDGFIDLAVSNASNNNVGVLLGSGSGSFAAALTFACSGSTPHGLTAGDFDADGTIDLVVAAANSHKIVVLLGNGSGGFASPDELRPTVLDFDSPHAVRFGIQTRGFAAGQLVEGSGNAFDGMGWLEVVGQTYAPTLPSDFLTDGGRTLVTPTVVIVGLYVSREITVPDTGNEDFARTIDVFANPTDSPITTTVRIVGNLGSDDATTVWRTSDGDTLMEPTDQWIGTDDADGSGTPAIVHYIHGPVGLQPTMVRLTGDRGDNIEWTYQITVPARQTVRLAHFTILADTRAEAEEAANALVTADGFGAQADAFLTQKERQSIANFDYLAPTAAENSYEMAEDSVLSISAPGVLENDSDPNGDTLTAILVTGPAHGSLQLRADGSFTFTPDENYHGPDSFTYRANDGRADSVPVTVTITVTPVNDAPAGADATITMLEDTSYTFSTADFGFTDPDDTPPYALNRVKITSLPTAGSLKLDDSPVEEGQFVSVADIVAGKLSFEPAPNASGTSYATFTFQVEDDGGTADGGANLDPTANTLTFDVTAVNDPPVVRLSNALASLAEDTDTSSRVEVAQVVIEDNDQGDNLLSLTGPDAALFEILDGKLYLKAGTTLDFESKPTLDFTVEVDDPMVGGTPDDFVVLSIAVTDVNEPPSVALTTLVISILENTNLANRLKVANITVTDDVLGDNQITLTGPDADLFEIVGDVLYLKAGAVLNHTTNPVLDVTVAVDDPTVGSTPDDSASLAIAVTAPVDLRMQSVQLSGGNQVTLNYEIVGGASTPFEIGFFRSTDTAFGGDVLSDSVAIDSPEDLAAGLHSKTFTIGGGTDHVALPGAGEAEVDTDYFLLAVADSQNLINESNWTNGETNNTVVITGVYHLAGGIVMAHGTAANEIIKVLPLSAPNRVRLDLGGNICDYAAGDLTGMRIRGHAGNDQLQFTVGGGFGTANTLAFLFNGGSGTNTAAVWGSTSTTTKDVANIYPMKADLTGLRYSLSLATMRGMTIVSQGGPDEAYIYDSSLNDTFTAYPTYVTLRNSLYTNRADGFRYVWAYAQVGGAYKAAGGNDVAYFYGIDGTKDFFRASAMYAIMADTETTRGVTYFVRGNWFEEVHAYGHTANDRPSSIERDKANLFDAPTSDLFEAETAAALATYRFSDASIVYAHTFRVVKAYGSSSDTANLYGPGTFTPAPNPVMYVSDYSVWANGFAPPNWYSAGRPSASVLADASVPEDASDAALSQFLDEDLGMPSVRRKELSRAVDLAFSELPAELDR